MINYLEKLLQKKYNEDLINRTSFQNLRDISKSYKRADMEDDIDDIIYEPNLEKKENLNSPLKETKKVIIKEILIYN